MALTISSKGWVVIPAELRWMMLEVFELPDESLDVMINKLWKMGTLTSISARLILLWVMKRREEEGRRGA